MGRRRSRSRGGLSRRRFLAGGLLSLGGASLLGGTQAFSQVDATRATSVQTAGDANGLLGLEIATSVGAGADAQQFADVTNNASEPLSLTVSPIDGTRGTATGPSMPLSPGETASISVSVNEDSPTGDGAFPVEISATGAESIGITLTRAVAVTPPAPALKRHVRDVTANGASYEVSYEVLHLEDFDGIEVTFENLDSGWATETRTANTREGTVTYSTGGTDGDQYQITLSVFDTSGSVALTESVSEVANGRSPDDNDDLGSPSDPVLDSFTLTDDSQNNPHIEIDYQVSNLDAFQRVEVDVVDRTYSWGTEMLTNDSPDGSVTYTRGGAMGHEVDVTVRAVNQSGTTTSSGTLTHVVGSGGTKNWPE